MPRDIQLAQSRLQETFLQFVSQQYPGSDEDCGGKMKAAFDVVEHLFPGQKSELETVFSHLLDNDFADAELEEFWEGFTPTFRLQGKNALRGYLQACRTYLVTGKEDGIDPIWRRNGPFDKLVFKRED